MEYDMGGTVQQIEYSTYIHIWIDEWIDRQNDIKRNPEWERCINTSVENNAFGIFFNCTWMDRSY